MKTNFLEFAKDILIEAFFQTLYMTAVATIFATIIGFIIAITLVITDSNGLRPNKKLNDVLGGIIKYSSKFSIYHTNGGNNTTYKIYSR